MKQFLEELKNFHRRFSKLELVIVIIFILLILFIPYKPDIIGFSDVKIHKQNIDLAFDSSLSFIIDYKKPVALTSISVSGEVLGPGSVQMVLMDEQGKEIKMYSNDEKKNFPITGFHGKTSKLNNVKSSEPVLEIKQDSSLNSFESFSETFSGEFTSENCVLNPNEKYKLIAYVEPGTTLILDEIVYTTKED